MIVAGTSDERASGPEPLTVEALEHWARAGAHWRVVHWSERRVVVELQQCTGEPVERRASDASAVIAYLDGVESDLDLTVGEAGR